MQPAHFDCAAVRVAVKSVHSRRVHGAAGIHGGGFRCRGWVSHELISPQSDDLCTEVQQLDLLFHVELHVYKLGHAPSGAKLRPVQGHHLEI